eukprot:15078740-Heterocapsa_arctica.AAC.1
MPLSEGLSPTDQSWFGCWERHLLRSPAEAYALKTELGFKDPYMDPVLRHNPVEDNNHFFLAPSDGDPGRLGVFCVVRKDNSLLLVFDTRGVNRMFRDPPSARLPSAGAFSRVEVTL